MHEPSFLAGLELGKFLHRVRRLEAGVAELRADLDGLRHHLRRFAILGALWAFGMVANASTDKAAEFAFELALSVLKR